MDVAHMFIEVSASKSTISSTTTPSTGTVQKSVLLRLQLMDHTHVFNQMISVSKPIISDTTTPSMGTVQTLVLCVVDRTQVPLQVR